MAIGHLVVSVFVDNIAQPINKATVNIIGENFNISTLTNISGKTNEIELFAPDEIYSMTPQEDIKPFSEYTIIVSKEGLNTSVINGVQIFPNVTSYQEVYLSVQEENNIIENISQIPNPTLWEEFPPKIVDEEITTSDKGKVLPRVIIPEYIIVHDGIPTNTNASNYVISFSDYIKNVASSEIYPNWPKEALKANIYAILSFTLNRIYTEWYPSRGYDFTITSSTAYDQKYTHGRTIFDTISNVVDEIFLNYLKYPGQSNPYLAHYNDGINVNNPGWLSQWGSKSLADQGYSALQIVRYYYGNTIGLATAELVSSFPTSFPGYNLEINACGEEVQKIQNELNKIRGSYPAIPVINNPNGIYDATTANAVRTFQSIFNLPVTGIVNYATWYRISYIYVAVSNMLKGIYD